ncbi:MAG: RNA 2',3'-cyclic phosphodiesterase [Candidatus Omnitrophota bacterium]|nr:RNA 2',3'-cyclic phosphodiesterase [Candidatus Omnitrophota bacterium]
MPEENLRTFLALPIAESFPREIKFFLEFISSRVDGINWVRAENTHVTLHFFGRTSRDDVAVIKDVAGPLAEKCAPIAVNLREVGYFPNQQQPRITWIGLGGKLDDLLTMQQSLEHSLKLRGFPVEERPFRPHVTVGRTRKGESAVGSLDAVEMQPTETRIIDKIILYQSLPAPGGPRYEPLETFPLSG